MIRRHSRLPLVLALSSIITASLATGASSATGPGGWNRLGDGGTAATPSLDGGVLAITPGPGVLMFGGAFLHAGGVSRPHFALWDGSDWGSLPGTPQTLNGDVHAIANDAANGRIFIGGNFTNAGGNADADYLAMWDIQNSGAGWQPFCNSSGPAFTASVAALQIVGGTLYVGGSFADGAGIPAADKLLACDLTTGASSATVSSSDDINSGVYALAADSNGILYAGGTFINLDGIKEADHVAAYNTTTGLWHAMGSGPAPNYGAVTDVVRTLTANGTDVYVGTDAKDVSGIPAADNVARWDGSAWSAVGSNTAGTDGWFPASTFIYALTTSASLLFATGSFLNANGDPRADHIAYFDGTSWHPIGSDGAGGGPWGASGNGLSLAVWENAVVAGGSFTSAGGDTNARYAASFPFWRPDVRIGAQIGGPFVGNNVFSSTGVGEGKRMKVARGHTGSFFLSFQNDGLVSDIFTIHGTGGATGFAVRYLRTGGGDVTTQVKNGTFSPGALASGATFTLKMTVLVGPSGKRVAAYLIKASSTAGGAPDAVIATVTVPS